MIRGLKDFLRLKNAPDIICFNLRPDDKGTESIVDGFVYPGVYSFNLRPDDKGTERRLKTLDFSPKSSFQPKTR